MCEETIASTFETFVFWEGAGIESSVVGRENKKSTIRVGISMLCEW